MARRHSVDALIVDLYATACHVEQWPDVLTRVADWLGADGVHAILSDRVRGVALGGAVGRVDPDAHPEYLRDYHASDIRLPRLHRLPMGSIVHDHELMSEAERAVSRFHHEFLAKYHCEQLMLGTAQPSPGIGLDFIVGRSRKRGELGEQSRRRMAQLLPHLARSFRLHLQMTRAERLGRMLASLADDATFALVLLDAQGSVVHCNRMAQRLMRLKRLLAVRDGLLRISGADRIDFLETDLQRVRTAGAAVERIVHAEDETGRVRPYAVQVMPVDGGYAVLAVPPGGDRRLSIGVMAEIHGLSPKECEVAAHLAAGRRPDAIARELGVALNTVRAHLRNLFQKTGTGRQAELVALLKSGVPATSRLFEVGARPPDPNA